MTIKNVIFDLGNVLIDFHPLEYIKSLGYDDNKALEILNCTIKDKIWNDMDKGIYQSKNEYIKAFCLKYPHLKDEITNFLSGPWMENVIIPIKENQKMIELVKQKGLKYYILSNYPKDAFAYTYDLCPFIRNADGMLISYSVLKVKPEKEIYLELLDRYKLNADECLFIDDLPANIKGAESVGIKGIVHKNLDDTYKELERYLNQCNNI